jgi:SAM-dependent MidA family methyltransferase
MTVAAFMALALYDPDAGYYARAARRTGRAGDFFTSVDVGPAFGELLEIQIAEMARLLDAAAGASLPFDLVEAGAGDGRLASDVLAAAGARDPWLLDRLRLHLVERSAAARAAQPGTLGDHAARLAGQSDRLPASFEGVLMANELLDAMPVHQVVNRDGELREIYVAAAGDGLAAEEGPPSTPRLREHMDAVGIRLEPGWRAEIGLEAIDWIRDAARRLRRGFLILIDYGHEAGELYSERHAAGTLTTFAGHQARGAETAGRLPWLETPGDQDLTAHVDFTSVRAAAEAEGLATIGFLDQTYFLMGLLAGSAMPDPESLEDFQRRHGRALRTLLMPGGLGSTMKVLMMAKGVGAPALRGCSYRVRVT